MQLLTDLLQEALQSMGLVPCRDPQALQKVLREHTEKRFYLDVMERSIARNTDFEAQREEYSGKKKIIR